MKGESVGKTLLSKVKLKVKDGECVCIYNVIMKKPAVPKVLHCVESFFLLGIHGSTKK